jgi:uncharacterized membrane protein
VSTWTTYLRQLHHLLNRQGVYPVFLSSLLGVILLAARIYVSHSTTSVYMTWNLFLAWVASVASLWAWRLNDRFPWRWWLALGPGWLWLLFYPNAPYSLTDFWHVMERLPVPLWYDAGMLSF